MAKSGLEYQELVALVAAALDPNAIIKTGQWLEGPDGDREVDVEVRGTANGLPHFVLIECKDWKKPVDIQEIDKLDSKRRDLSADAAILYSNSGFTKKALRKSERVGIGAVSAIIAGNKQIRPCIEREMVAKALSVDTFQMTLYPNDESLCKIPNGWDYRTLLYQSLPVANWLAKFSTEILSRHEPEGKVVEVAAMKEETPFTLDGTLIILRGFRIEMSCSRKWLSQTVREDVSLGVYDHIARRLTVPSNQFWSLGPIDREAWNVLSINAEPEEWGAPLEPNSFRLNLTLLKSIPQIEGNTIPLIDELIGERQASFERL